jgi:arylsulfatase A-like enzyme
MKSQLTFTALALSSALFAQQKPNILWLTYEDTSPEFIGCYGNKQAHTPNIDHLAKEGVRFDAAYSTGAVSSASRFCLITGVRPSGMGTGNHRSGYAIPENIKGFPYYLRQAGYYTANNVKTDYNIFNAKQFIADAWDDCSEKAGWWNRRPGQPFFAVYNSVASHQSRTMTNSWTDYEQKVLSKLDDSEKIKEGNLIMPEFYRNSPEMQHNISRVYNSISLMDKEFGQWLDRLERDGLKDSTIVFCFSDHGEGITRGKGSAVNLGYKVAFIAWFPPIYKHLSPWGAGVGTDELVSFDDMAPTVLKLAGIPLPDYMKGRVFMGSTPTAKRKYVFPALDRTDESSELSRSVTDGRYLFTRVFMPFQPFVRWNMYYDVSDLQKQIRVDYKANLLNDKQKSILEPRQAEYLFDLQNDTWETVNLIEKPELKTKADELRNALKNELIKVRDAHFMTEYAFKTTKIMPYQLAADDNNYPIKEILDAALLVGKGKNAVNEQMKLLSDKNKYVRYWASIGLFSQECSLKNKEKQLLKLLATEDFPPAQINLSVLLFKISENFKFKENVQILLLQKDPELLRMTMHLLVSLDNEKQLQILDAVETRFEQTNKNKAMNPANNLMELMLHALKGKNINGDDSF